jgi:hypothetical protein
MLRKPFFPLPFYEKKKKKGKRKDGKKEAKFNIKWR